MTQLGSCLLIVTLALSACHSDDNAQDLSDIDLAATLDLGPSGEVDLSTDDSNTVEPSDDGGSVVPTGDAGTNAISCGGMPCDTSTNVCCFTSSTATCEPQSSCMMGVSRTCDGPEDCPASMAICCVKGFGATTCDATCTMGLHACHTKADCPASTQVNRVAACCPVSSTLRTCLDLSKNSVPASCN